MSDCSRSVALAGARRTKTQDIGALVEPGVAIGERHKMSFADSRDGGEIECLESLAPWQARFGKVPRNASGIAIGDLQIQRPASGIERKLAYWRSAAPTETQQSGLNTQGMAELLKRLPRRSEGPVRRSRSSDRKG
jgi:hypothetical protein